MEPNKIWVYCNFQNMCICCFPVKQRNKIQLSFPFSFRLWLQVQFFNKYIIHIPWAFFISANIFDKRWFAWPRSSILRSSGQVDRIAILIPWNVVNGGVKLYFCWKSYKVMKSPLSVKRSWISVIPESCHLLIKKGLYLFWWNSCARAEISELLRYCVRLSLHEIRLKYNITTK